MLTATASACLESGSWYLEGYIQEDNVARRYALKPLPFRIGRHKDANVTIQDKSISNEHAEIYDCNGQLRLRDLSSSNGSFKNGNRVTEDVSLNDGDILNFSHFEFVLGREPDSEPIAQTELKWPRVKRLKGHAANAKALRELLERRLVVPHFQPVLEFDNPQNIGFEILGRGNHEALPKSPAKLFETAERIGLEVELSDLFRREGLNMAQVLPGPPNLFINTHPSELKNKVLGAALAYVREQLPTQRITVEIHEASVTDPAMMRALKTVLTEHDMGIAYDDFGSGQARLLELVEVPPDYLKFDISLVSGIDKASAPRQKMLQALVEIVRDLGIACVAEGIEHRGELVVCRQMGFEYGQGFLLGRPAPAQKCDRRWRQAMKQIKGPLDAPENRKDKAPNCLELGDLARERSC